MKKCGVSLILLVLMTLAVAEDCNIKIVTDASPDYADMTSLVRSVTSQWPTPKEKCWAMFYWNHIARRQTAPMRLHGFELTDPIRQFNDYGFTMCSTISGINQSIWEYMGLKHKFWDIHAHTVAEVEYDNAWHMYDSSLSAIYTLCDGTTIAGVEDIGKDGACACSGGKSEPGHIARYHCLTGTSKNGFLSGGDTDRSLESEGTYVFRAPGLLYRWYFYSWDNGHRYILNLRDNEVYTRYYCRLDDKGGASYSCDPAYFVPNGNDAKGNPIDPESPNPRYHVRGNGVWIFKPVLTAPEYKSYIHTANGIIAAKDGGLQPEKAGVASEAVFRVQSANVTTSQKIVAKFFLKSVDDSARILVSTNNGLKWNEVWKSSASGDVNADLKLVGEVNGSYEPMLKVELTAKAANADAVLKSLEIETTTELNTKAQPKLTLGKNTIYVGLGDQTESIVFWPELQNGKYKEHIVEEKNVAAQKEAVDYRSVLYPEKNNEDGYVVYRLNAPGDMTRLVYGGRFFHRAISHIDLLYSLDDGKTWTKNWTLQGGEDKKPWDVIHYETVDIPAGHRSVLVKYLMNSTSSEANYCGIYALRIEADYTPPDTAFKPIEVTFKWKEVQKDRSTAERSHTQLVEKTPFKYNINVGGDDLLIMESLQINLKGAVANAQSGYSDGKDAGGEKFLPVWVTYGKNLAEGKSYTCSLASEGNWGAGDTDGKRLTDGTMGPPFAGGNSYKTGALWSENKNPVITLDLGTEVDCASFGMNAHGYPCWDTLKGEVQDKIEVLVSADNKEFKSVGMLQTNLRRRDIPINHMLPDDETLTGHTFRLIPEKPVKTRYVQFKIQNKRFIDVTELEVLDSIKFEPFDLRIALPGDAAKESAK